MVFYIILAEISFWIFIAAGLMARYLFKKSRLSLWLLGATPLIDALLIILTVMDLKNGGEAQFAHALATIYIGVSIAFGKQMIHWADDQFQYFILKTKRRPPKTQGIEKGKKEVKGWLRHLLAYIIGGGCMGAMIWLLPETNTEAIFNTWRVWSLALLIDFVISFSYLLFPSHSK